jgi:dipeptidyl aminopeptidase/acylaminoacyl peptidase
LSKRNLFVLGLIGVVCLSGLGRANMDAPDGVRLKSSAPTIGFKDIAETRDFSQVTLSPGGKYAAYILNIPDVQSNSHRQELYSASDDGGEIRRIQTPQGSEIEAIQWWPDGRRFAFLLRSGGTAQVYSATSDAALIQPLTRLAGGVDQYALSPAGDRLALIGSDAAQKRIWLQEAAASAEAVPLSGALNRPAWLRWQPDGRRVFFLLNADSVSASTTAMPSVVNWHDEPQPPRHVRSLDIDTRQERTWTSGADFSVLNFEISSDGKHLAFQTQSAERTIIAADPELSTLRILRLENGEMETLVPKWGGPGQCSYTFSGDGLKLAFVAPDRLEYQRFGKLHILDLAGRRSRIHMAKADLPVRTVFWNETSDGLYFIAGLRTDRPWFFLQLSDDRLSRITVVPGSFSGRFVPEARAFIFGFSDWGHPLECFRATAESLADRSRWVQLSRANARLASFSPVTAETVRWKSGDGREIEGVLYKPMDYDPGRHFPMIVQANGGRNAYGGEYQSYAPVLAARGYLVFQPNHRGLVSADYGENFKLESFYPRDIYESAASDVLSGVQALVDRGIADGDRLGLMGWSVGGGTADWLMIKTTRFKAISSGAGGGDMIAAYGQIQRYRSYYRNTWGGSAFRFWDRYADRSALRYISRAKTPTLIQVGENDDGVSAQCLETYNALREFRVPVEMLIHRGQPHSLQTPQTTLAKMLAEYYWFEQWIRGGPSWLKWGDEFAASIAGR